MSSFCVHFPLLVLWILNSKIFGFLIHSKDDVFFWMCVHLKPQNYCKWRLQRISNVHDMLQQFHNLIFTTPANRKCVFVRVFLYWKATKTLNPKFLRHSNYLKFPFCSIGLETWGNNKHRYIWKKTNKKLKNTILLKKPLR